MKGRLVIVGAGGAGSEAAWIARGMRASGKSIWEVVGFFDDNPELWGREVDGIPVLRGTRNARSAYEKELPMVHIAVGRVAARARIAEVLAGEGFQFATLTHSTAVIAESAVVADGCMIGPFSVVAPYARLGPHVLVNSHVGVGHHAYVGAFSTLCPGSRVSGACQLGEGVFVGSNAVILPRLRIGDRATVAASSMVVRSVASLHTVMGVPARIASRPKDAGSDLHL